LFWCVFQQFEYTVSFSLIELPIVHLSAVLSYFANTKSKIYSQQGVWQSLFWGWFHITSRHQVYSFFFAYWINYCCLPSWPRSRVCFPWCELQIWLP
jgi:hypothetical protein